MHAEELIASSDFQAKWTKVQQLSNESNPAATPFKSIYEAREILTDLTSALKQTPPTPSQPHLLALLDYHLGLTHVQTEESTAGERLLSRAVASLRPVAGDRLYVATVVDALNQLGILWFDWGEHRKAVGLFEEANEVYAGFKERADGKGVGGAPVKE
ncbi:hypothetical protein HDU96_009841 [Phlyctochytrium bullatum]|nr:hypothetical protein HDU96_009841 [Phlyctochytrium bullatum]